MASNNREEAHGGVDSDDDGLEVTYGEIGQNELSTLDGQSHVSGQATGGRRAGQVMTKLKRPDAGNMPVAVVQERTLSSY
jgi:hypothetical protein